MSVNSDSTDEIIDVVSHEDDIQPVQRRKRKQVDDILNELWLQNGLSPDSHRSSATKLEESHQPTTPTSSPFNFRNRGTRIKNPVNINMIKSAIQSYNDPRGPTKMYIKKFISKKYFKYDNPTQSEFINLSLNQATFSGDIIQSSGRGEHSRFRENSSYPAKLYREMLLLSFDTLRQNGTSAEHVKNYIRQNFKSITPQKISENLKLALKCAEKDGLIRKTSTENHYAIANEKLFQSEVNQIYKNISTKKLFDFKPRKISNEYRSQHNVLSFNNKKKCRSCDEHQDRSCNNQVLLKKKRIQIICLYEFRKGNNVDNTLKSVQQLFGKQAVYKEDIENWFKEFRKSEEDTIVID